MAKLSLFARLAPALLVLGLAAPTQAQPQPQDQVAPSGTGNSLIPIIRQMRPGLSPADVLGVLRSAGDLMDGGATLDVLRDAMPRNRSLFDADPRFQAIIGGNALTIRPPPPGRPASLPVPGLILPDQTPFIIGGVQSADESTLLMQVDGRDGTRGPVCSATLVSPRAVVTAIHCLCEGLRGTRPPPFNLTLYKRELRPDGTPKWRAADSTRIAVSPRHPRTEALREVCAGMPPAQPAGGTPWHALPAFRSVGDMVIFEVPPQFGAGSHAAGVVPVEGVGTILERPGPGRPGFGLGRIVGWGSVVVSGAPNLEMERNEGTAATFPCATETDEGTYGRVPGREVLVARLSVRNDPRILPVADEAIPCRGDSGGPLQLLPLQRWQEIGGRPAAEQERLIGSAERWVAGVSSRRLRAVASSDFCGDGGVYAGFGPEAIAVLERLGTRVWRPEE